MTKLEEVLQRWELYALQVELAPTPNQEARGMRHILAETIRDIVKDVRDSVAELTSDAKE